MGATNGGPAPDVEALTARPGPGSHRTTMVVGGRRVETLADLPPLRNRLLFVGLNPSPVSVAAGHYHQGPLGKRFWSRLIRAGILRADTDLATADDSLMAAGHGITDLSKRPTRRASGIDLELKAGVGQLWQKITVWRPAAVVFIYKGAAETAAGRKLAETWGQLEGVALAARPCFLMPAPYAARKIEAEALNFIRNLGASLPDG